MKKRIIIISSLLILSLCSGCSKKDTKEKVTTETKTEATTETQTEVSTKANSSSLKLNDSKDWVYDADYKTEGAPESYVFANVQSNLNDTKAPFININSPYAEYCNGEIKEVFDAAVKRYTQGYTDPNTFLKQCDYRYWINGDCLSVVMIYWRGGTDNIKPDYYIYNINLKTGAKMSGTEVVEVVSTDAYNTLYTNLQKEIDEAGEKNYSEYGTNAVQAFMNDSLAFKYYLQKNDYVRYFIADDGALCAVYPIAYPAAGSYYETVMTSNGKLDLLTQKYKH